MSINTSLRYWLDQVLNHGPLNAEDYKLAKKALIEATISDQPDQCTHEAFQGRCVHCDAPYVNGRVAMSPERESLNPMLMAALKDAVHFIRNRHNMGRGVREENRLAVLANAQEVLSQIEQNARRG